jgi:RNA recognition motif-containing protein
MKIYVGNLDRNVSEQDLQSLFATYGEVTSANVIKDKFTGESRGFGFVELGEGADGAAAIAELSGKELQGQRIRVSEAQPRNDRGGSDRGGFGGNRGPRSGGFGGPRSGGFGGSDRGPRRNSW